MRIGGTNMSPRTAPARPRPPGRGFALPDGDEGAVASRTWQAAPSASIDAVMPGPDRAGEDRPVSDREARRHGQAVLDALAGLQLAQLSGDPHASLAGLAKLAAEAPAASDPGLQAVLQAIAARAAVELARVT